MSNWRIVKDTEQYRELVNIKTGSIRKTPYCTEKQFKYINYLRSQLDKEPLKNKPMLYKVNSIIEKLEKKTRQQKLL